MGNDRTRQKLLITGATGYIGRRLTQTLLETESHQLRLFVRDARKLHVDVVHKVEVVEGDVLGNLDQALHGIDTAFYLIHSMAGSKDYREQDKRSAENFRDACIRQNVRRIIYLGGLGVRESASRHLLSRIETGEILSEQSEKIQTIWFRAGVIIGSGSSSFEIIRNLCQKLPMMITPRWVHTLTQPIGIDDVLRYLTRAISLKTKQNLIIDIGASPLRFQDMMGRAAKVMGLKRILIPVPLLSPHLSSYWLTLFTPVPYRLAAALVEGLRSETLLQNDNASRFFPDIVPLEFDETVRRATRELETSQVISRWCDSHSDGLCDIRDFDQLGGAILRDIRMIPLKDGQSTQKVFSSICSLGGKHGWYRFTFLWRFRGLLDKLVGGYGLNRGRRAGKTLRIGDALDFWKVADIQEGKRLLLFAQMKVPGKAWLEFDLQPDQLVQTAHFLPRGLLGRIYWYMLIPLHHFIFADLAKNVTKADVI